jgi:hypothetical protein
MDNIEQLIAGLSKDAQVLKPAPRPWLLGLKWLAVAIAYLIISLAISGVSPGLWPKSCCWLESLCPPR